MPEWFASWFDSPYYPLLYAHRDEKEAGDFITRLLASLQLPKGSHILDLACGRGRHSRYLHANGYRVTGLDLSPESIQSAKTPPLPGLEFQVHDMREPLTGTYDCILNLFTSFGYFQSDEEHMQVLKHIADALKPGGWFVMDFLNADYVIPRIVPEVWIQKDQIRFHILKHSEAGRIVKDIHVVDPLAVKGAQMDFREEVRIFAAKELTTMLSAVGLHVQNTWGSYEGESYDRESSPRLILFCRN